VAAVRAETILTFVNPSNPKGQQLASHPDRPSACADPVAPFTPLLYSACAGSMRLQSGSGILKPSWQIGSSILTP
jgi:hypothetical protein